MFGKDDAEHRFQVDCRRQNLDQGEDRVGARGSAVWVNTDVRGSNRKEDLNQGVCDPRRRGLRH